MGYKEILKVSDDVSTINIWHNQNILALESFLTDIKNQIQQHQLPRLPIAISYMPDASTGGIEKTVQLLEYTFTQMGLFTTLCPLVDDHTLSVQLNVMDYAVVLCTPQYAAKVGKGSAIWNVLDNFGKKKKNALHPLLCEGEFRDVALQIVDGHYLIRSFHAILNQDPLIAFPALIDIIFHLSGSQGLGLLPDVLNIKETVNAQSEAAYKKSFSQLQINIQKHTIDYRLKASLEESIQHHSLKIHNERPQINALVEGFLPSEAKVGLFFCQNKADTLLASLNLAEILSQNTTRVLRIDCAKYPGQASWDCVQKALKALKLKSADIEAMKQEPLIIVLNGYQDLGAYDNLWVKNALSTWANVKLLVTCQADYFKERGYLRCFLGDVSNRRVEDIAVYPIPTFASLEAQMAAFSITVAPDVNQDVEQYPISDKRKAEYVELTRFLERLNQIWVEKDYLKSALHQNPQIFISHAWEEKGSPELAHQHGHLFRISHDFSMLGYPIWLDIQRMSGDIDKQMEKGIAESDGALVIETPRYIERSNQATNVKKEWDAIYKKSQQQAGFRVFPLQFLPNVYQTSQTLAITSFLANHANRCDFTQIDEDYLARMTHPESGLIPRWLCDTPEKKVLYQNAYAPFQQDLQLLVGKHLVTNQGQADVLAFDMDNRLKGYIAPFGLVTEDSPMDSRFDLAKYFEEFLNNPECKTAIVLGRPGSGKSLFALSTFMVLLEPWRIYQNTSSERPQWLPIYIQLRSYALHPEQAIQEALKQQLSLKDTDINALRQGLDHQQSIIFILDGYDELGSGVRPNYTEVLKDWPRAKLLITSRPEHFDKDHRPLEVLTLKTAEGRTLFNSAQEAYVSPFSQTEIERYVAQYQGGKGINTYQTLKDLPGVMVLLDNPFLLTLVLQSLPQLLDNRKAFPGRDIVRTDIYDAFTQTWFLQETRGRELKVDACRTFSEELAFRLFTARTISVSDSAEKKDLWTFFNHPGNHALQDASLLRQSGGEYRFIHKSVYEYFAARRLWRALQDSERYIYWQSRNIVEEQPIIDILAELYRIDTSFVDKEERLFTLVKGSRFKDFSTNASVNAITVLNAARVCFSGADLSDIRIPGANLSGAILDNTKLERVDLTNVNFTGAWLHGTNFTHANMKNVELGEYSEIKFKGYRVRSCAYSPDGRYFILTGNHQSELYDAKTFKLLHTEEDAHRFVVFSPNGEIFATTADEPVLVFWQIKETNFILRKSTTLDYKCVHAAVDNLNCIAFSPDGKLLARGEGKDTILTYVENKAFYKIFKGHTKDINSVAFNHDGKLLATGSDDHTTKLWSVASGTLEKTLDGHTGSVTSVAFSRNGQLLVTGSADSTVNFWDVNSGVLQRTLKGHTARVSSVVFSPTGKLLATSSDDCTSKLWDVNSGVLQRTLEGHTKEVNCVAFSPDEEVLITGSHDTARFWKIKSCFFQKRSDEHRHSITRVAFATPDGRYLTTMSADLECKIWNTRRGTLIGSCGWQIEGGEKIAFEKFDFNKNGTLLAAVLGSTIFIFDLSSNVLRYIPPRYFTPHNKERVYCATFSPNNQLLATGGNDGSAKLWNVENLILLKMFERIGNVWSVAFSADGQILATGSTAVNLWCVETGVLLRTLKIDESYSYSSIEDIVFSPDGKDLAARTTRYTVLWSVEKEFERRGVMGARSISCFAFSPDSKIFAQGHDFIDLWVDSIRVSRTTISFVVKSLAFYQNNEETFLASGHDDHSVRFWKIILKVQKFYLQLLWSTHQDALLSQDACIEQVHGLSQTNVDLLLKRGAIGKPLMLSEKAKIVSNASAGSSASSHDINDLDDNGKPIDESTQKKCTIM